MVVVWGGDEVVVPRGADVDAPGVVVVDAVAVDVGAADVVDDVVDVLGVVVVVARAAVVGGVVVVPLVAWVELAGRGLAAVAGRTRM